MTQRAVTNPFEADSLRTMIEPFTAGFDFILDHIVITDPNGNIIYANRAAQINTGFSFAAMYGKNPGDLWGGHMPDDFYKEMWQTIKVEKKPWVGEVKNRKQDGTEHWQELRITPVVIGSGEVAFFIAVEPNIDDRVANERKLEEVLLDGERLRSAQALRIADLEAAVAKNKS